MTISTHVPRAGDDGDRPACGGQGTDFNPRPPCGRRQRGSSLLFVFPEFQPTSPVRETTCICFCCTLHKQFQPTSPVRETSGILSPASSFSPKFQPTSPVRETTRAKRPRLQYRKRFQPTSPVRETTFDRRGTAWLIGISTHVPRAGDDRRRGDRVFPGVQISTHVPRAGDDSSVSRSKALM